MNNEKQNIKERYVRKFLVSKKGTKNPQIIVKGRGGNKDQLKLNIKEISRMGRKTSKIRYSRAYVLNVIVL